MGEKLPYFCIVKTNKTYDNEDNEHNEDSEILPQGGKKFRGRFRRNQQVHQPFHLLLAIL